MPTAKKADEAQDQSMGFALVVQASARRLDLTPKDMSKPLGKAYDTIRRIYNGQSFPGPSLLIEICKLLKLNYNEMYELVQIDRTARKGVFKYALNEDPMITDIKRHWKHLTDADQKSFYELILLKAKSNVKSATRMSIH